MDDMGGFPRGGIPVLQNANNGGVRITDSASANNQEPLLYLSSTYNNAAVTFSGSIQYDLTDLASNAASLAVRIRQNGTDVFTVRKDGRVFAYSGMTYYGQLADADSKAAIQTSALPNGLYLLSTGTVAWTNDNTWYGTKDVFLYRDAAGVLCQRNATNAQATRIYNTWTDASNYERFAIDWQTTANVCLLRTEALGTGTLHGMSIQQATGALSFFGATPVTQPAGAGQAVVTLGNADSEIGGLTISAAYDQTEVQALRDKCEELADDVRALSTLVHALRTALVDLGAIKGAA